MADLPLFMNLRINQQVPIDVSYITAGGPSSSAVALFTSFTNVLVNDITMTNTANFYDGAVVVQGTVGTFLVMGGATTFSNNPTVNYNAKLWDGTTVIASGSNNTQAQSTGTSFALSGVIKNPAGNLRISVNDSTHTTDLIKANDSGAGKDTYVVAIRIG